MKKLKQKIRDFEDLLDFLERNQIKFNGYNFIITEIKELKIELAELEAQERIYNHKLIQSN